MGLFDLFSDKKLTVKINKDEHRWIDLSFICFFGDKFSKKQIIEIASDMLKILLDTQIILNSKNEPLGVVNSYLGMNPNFENIPKDAIFIKPQKIFISEVEENPPSRRGKWKISLKPKKGINNFYSLSEYYYDLSILFNAGEWILRKYSGMGTAPTFNPIFINGKPALEQIERLTITKYLVEDRLKYGENENKNLDRACLGYTIKEKFKLIKDDLSTSTDKKLDEKWLSQVEKLLTK